MKMTNPKSIYKTFLTFCLLWTAFFAQAQQIQRVQFKGSGESKIVLTVECWDDDLIHFRFGDDKTAGKMFINTTPSIAKTDYTGATEFQQNGNTIETRDLKVVYNPYSATVTLIDKQQKDLVLVSFTPTSVDGIWRGFRAYKKSHTHFFGLGQQFDYSKLGNVSFDWNGKKTYKWKAWQ
jgi:alpha-glucosidase